MLQSMIDNMPEKTGKSLEEWIALLKQHNFEKHSQAMNFLKKEHGVTHGFANTIVHLSKADEQPAEEDLVAGQYAGKESLRPIYDRLLALAEGFGGDVEVAPKKAYVSLRRSKQFAILQPSTKSRFDLGLNIKGRDAEGGLEEAGKWNSMCSHRVRLGSVEEVTEEVAGWLREAYEGAG